MAALATPKRSKITRSRRAAKARGTAISAMRLPSLRLTMILCTIWLRSFAAMCQRMTTFHR